MIGKHLIIIREHWHKLNFAIWSNHLPSRMWLNYQKDFLKKNSLSLLNKKQLSVGDWMPWFFRTPCCKKANLTVTYFKYRVSENPGHIFPNELLNYSKLDTKYYVGSTTKYDNLHDCKMPEILFIDRLLSSVRNVFPRSLLRIKISSTRRLGCDIFIGADVMFPAPTRMSSTPIARI